MGSIFFPFRVDSSLEGTWCQGTQKEVTKFDCPLKMAEIYQVYQLLLNYYFSFIAITVPGLAFGGTIPLDIWLDDVTCSGDEPALGACKHQPWGVSNCQHIEDAGVVCIPRSCKYNYSTYRPVADMKTLRAYTNGEAPDQFEQLCFG